VADLHWYLRPAWGDLSKDAAAAVLDRANLLRGKAAGKPALLGEFGLADDQWKASPFMAQDKAWLHFHDALWASALSGLSGTALFWWWDSLDRGDAYRHYKPVADFVADIPFTTARLRPAAATPAGTSRRVVGLQGSDCAYLWISDAAATWWKVVAEKSAPGVVKDETIRIEGLDAGPYAVRWWDTDQGKVVREEGVEHGGRALQLAVPAFTRDIGCQIVQKKK
jgi:hypothetical protein